MGEQKRMWKYLIVGLCLILLVLSGKRAFVLFSIMGILVVGIQYAPKGKKMRNFFRFFLGITVILLIIELYLQISGYSSLVSIGSSFFRLDSEDISTSRFSYWEYAWNLFTEKPIVGIGWRQYLQIHNVGLAQNHVHNIYLQLLCETGLIGFAVIFGAMITILVKTGKNLVHINNRIKDDGQLYEYLKYQKLLQASLYIQIFVLLYGITGNPLYDEIFFVPYSVACMAGLCQLKN